MNKFICGILCIATILLGVSDSVFAEETSPLIPKILSPSGEQPSFQHVITLPKYPGLEGMLGFSPKDRSREIHLVRALLLLDGNLLVLPLSALSSQKTYQVKFPAPATSMQYQFQIVYRDGKSLVSEPFTLDPHCKDEVLIGFSVERMRFTGQKELLEKGQLHKHNEKVLNSIIHNLRTIVGDSLPTTEEASPRREESEEEML